MTDIRLEDGPRKGRYVIDMPNGEKSLLTFVRRGENHIVIDHTFVPPSYRGQGHAERLVERAIGDARAAGVKITPTCWYVAAEFRRHPEWADLLQA